MILTTPANQAPTETFTGVMDHVAQGFEALGAAVLVVGIVWAFVLAVVAWRRSGQPAKGGGAISAILSRRAFSQSLVKLDVYQPRLCAHPCHLASPTGGDPVVTMLPYNRPGVRVSLLNCGTNGLEFWRPTLASAGLDHRFLVSVRRLPDACAASHAGPVAVLSCCTHHLGRGTQTPQQHSAAGAARPAGEPR